MRAVTGLSVQDGRVASVTLAGGSNVPCAAAVICTGGASYPSTGSTGDGVRHGWRSLWAYGAVRRCLRWWALESLRRGVGACAHRACRLKNVRLTL